MESFQHSFWAGCFHRNRLKLVSSLNWWMIWRFVKGIKHNMNMAATLWNTDRFIYVLFCSVCRFKAQDDARGSEWRRANQGLPSTGSQAEEWQHQRTEGLRPAEQNLPLPDLWRSRQLWDPTQTGRNTHSTQTFDCSCSDLSKPSRSIQIEIKLFTHGLRVCLLWCCV